MQGQLPLSPHVPPAAALELAAAVEQTSNHPLAHAIVAAHIGCVGEVRFEPIFMIGS